LPVQAPTLGGKPTEGENARHSQRRQEIVTESYRVIIAHPAHELEKMHNRHDRDRERQETGEYPGPTESTLGHEKAPGMGPAEAG
jgi:hypothetical protein